MADAPSLEESNAAAVAAPSARPHTKRSYWIMLKRAALAAGLTHVAFSVLFFWVGTPLMGWANIGSVGLYVMVYGLLGQRRNQQASVLMWLEILLHGVVATWVLGWDSGFHYYVLLIVPMVFVSPGRTMRLKVLLGLTLGAYYAGLDLYAHHVMPRDAIPASALDGVRYFNIASTLGLLAFLANSYYSTVQRAERRLEDLATTDALTGLSNRRRAMDVVGGYLRRRRTDGTALSFILCDVDHFKAVNDRLGHDVGDRVLSEVAAVMKTATREQDTVSRWGGEEFLIVLPGTDAAAALQVAERVRVAVAALEVAGLAQPLKVTATFGISTLAAGEAVEAAIARADAAMYRGKIEGRNRCEVEASPETEASPQAEAPSAAHG